MIADPQVLWLVPVLLADVSVASGDADIDAIRLIQTRSIAHADGQENCDVIKHDFTFPSVSDASSHGRDTR